MTDQDIIDRFHVLSYHNPAGWQGSKWLGIPCMQNPNDVWVIQEIMADVRPDVVIETGTAHGGGTALWATLLRAVNPASRLITIDLDPNIREYQIDPRVFEIPVVKDAVDFVIGSSVDPDTISKVAGIRDSIGPKTMVMLDSNHCAHFVVQELEAYAPLVSVGSYLIVQDTNLNGHPIFPGWGRGPWEALDDWLPGHPEFESDRSREHLLLHMHPRGYLRRLR